MTTIDGGKAVDGAEIGDLMLEVRFPGIPGDVGEARTWPCPVRYRVVCCALPDRLVRRSTQGLLPALI